LKAQGSKKLEMELPVGQHTLLAELSDGVTGWIQVVEIKGDQKTSLQAKPLTYGKLSVYFLGGVGEFKVNGKRFRAQPPFSEAKLPVGQHAVSCRFESEESARELVITVEEGMETIVEYEQGHAPIVNIEG